MSANNFEDVGFPLPDNDSQSISYNENGHDDISVHTLSSNHATNRATDETINLVTPGARVPGERLYSLNITEFSVREFKLQ
jgi:hypothetical protein